MGFLLEKCRLVKVNNKTGCRFLIVDAYNKDIPLAFCQKNEFQFLFSSEQQEAENLRYDVQKSLHTRLMYFDLKNLISSDVD